MTEIHVFEPAQGYSGGLEFLRCDRPEDAKDLDEWNCLGTLDEFKRYIEANAPEPDAFLHETEFVHIE